MLTFLSGTLLFSHTLPATNRLSGLDSCNDQFCYYGIKPHVSTLEEAQQNLSGTYSHGARLSTIVMSPDKSSGVVRVIELSPDQNNAIFELDLVIRQSTLTVSDVFDRLGAPC